MIAVAVAVVVHGRRVALLLLVAPLADILLWWWSCPGNPLPQDTAIVAARALSGGTRGFSTSWASARHAPRDADRNATRERRRQEQKHEEDLNMATTQRFGIFFYFIFSLPPVS